ncbi:hypothetical protein EsH8_III_000976 [Colletotrichum jinshuiense]
MCWTQKTIYTICAHSDVEVIECPKFVCNPDKTYRYGCIAPLCQHSQTLATVLGFCRACVDVYTGVDSSDVNSLAIIKNYWAYKAAHQWHYPVDPSRVPGSALLKWPQVSVKGWFSRIRTWGEVCEDMVVTASIDSLLHAIGEPLTSPLCVLCQAHHRKDTLQMAMGMRAATISWARHLKHPNDVLRVYTIAEGLSYICALEVKAAPGSEGQLQCSDLNKTLPPSPRSVASTSSSEFPRRPNAKAHWDIIVETDQILPSPEVTTRHKTSPTETRSSEYDSPINRNFPIIVDWPTFSGCYSNPEDAHWPKNDCSDSDGSWITIEGSDSPESSELGFRGSSLHFEESTYERLVGGRDEFLEQQRLARRSYYKESLHSEGEYSDDQDSGKQHSNEGQQANLEEMIDAHVQLYLDDEDKPRTERVRRLTYVSPPRSEDGDCTSSSPEGPRSQRSLPLPEIPPVSPFHFTDFDGSTDQIGGRQFHPDASISPRDPQRSHSDNSVEGPELKHDIDGNTFGPASPESSGVTPLIVPVLRNSAPPRPARGPRWCTTHGLSRQIGCHGCQVGALEEVSLQPGTRMNHREVEQL